MTIGKVVSTGSPKAIVTSSEPLSEEFDRYDCSIFLTPHSQKIKILGSSESLQPVYNVASMRILKIFCNKDFNSERKVVIKFTIDMKPYQEINGFGFSSIVSSLVEFDDFQMMKMVNDEFLYLVYFHFPSYGRILYYVDF